MAALTRGKVQLESEDLAGLRYAALELRFAMEALVYGRAAAMKEDFPENEYATWQPRKVMAVLLELDPNADKTRTIAMSKESTDTLSKARSGTTRYAVGLNGAKELARRLSDIIATNDRETERREQERPIAGL